MTPEIDFRMTDGLPGKLNNSCWGIGNVTHVQYELITQRESVICRIQVNKRNVEMRGKQILRRMKFLSYSTKIFLNLNEQGTSPNTRPSVRKLAPE
jgi:hypothetical protein